MLTDKDSGYDEARYEVSGLVNKRPWDLRTNNRTEAREVAAKLHHHGAVWDLRPWADDPSRRANDIRIVDVVVQGVVYTEA